MLDASRIQIGRNTESQNIGSSGIPRRLSDKDELSSSNASFLFSHLVKKKTDLSAVENQDDDVETPEGSLFKISDLVSPKRNRLSDECYKVLCESHGKAIPVFTPKSTRSGEADLFSEDEEVTVRLPTKDECYPDLRRPLRRLFEEDPDEGEAKAPKVVTPKKKIRNKKEKSLLNTLKTPVKNEPSTFTERTPVKLPVLEAEDFPLNHTPVKAPVIRTPVKTPAQKRGDQNVNVFAGEAELRTPVKTPAQKRGDQNVILSSNDRTPVKTTSPKTTPVKSLVDCSGDVSVKTPIKSSLSRKRKAKVQTEIKLAVTPEKQKEVSKPETFSTPISTTPAPTIERPSRRKSVSIRFGIDDVPLTDAIWSPAGKSSRDFKIHSSPWTPKNKLFASPSSHDLTPTSKTKIRKTPKSLFAADSDSTISVLPKPKLLSVAETVLEVPENDQTRSKKRKKKTEEAQTSKYEEENDPWIVLDPTTLESDHQEISADQSSGKRKSKRFKMEEEVRTPTVISFAKTLTEIDSNSSSPNPDLNDSLGQKIQKISLKQNQRKNSETFATPTPPVTKVKLSSSPKTRTPKRLRSGSKKLSPRSKRKRLHISFANSPPVINDTNFCVENRKRKLTETRSNENDETFSEPRSPPPSSVTPVSSSPMKSPGKFWSVVGREESPHGIKMRLNRKKKPEQKSMIVNRISRRMTNELGLPPEVLRQMVTLKFNFYSFF